MHNEIGLARLPDLSKARLPAIMLRYVTLCNDM